MENNQNHNPPFVSLLVKASCFSMTRGALSMATNQTDLCDGIFSEGARLAETTPADVRPDENRSPDSLEAVKKMQHHLTKQNKKLLKTQYKSSEFLRAQLGTYLFRFAYSPKPGF